MAKSYKGSGKNLSCRGFEYKVNETYTTIDEIKIGESGFHACDDYPLAVFNFYPPCNSRYAIVDQSGEMTEPDSERFYR